MTSEKCGTYIEKYWRQVMLLFDKMSRQVTKDFPRMPTESEVAWIRMFKPEASAVRELLQQLAGHPLMIEDCIKLNQRPKIDKYPSHLYITFFAVKENLSVAELAIVVGSNYIITIHNEEVPFLHDLEREFREIPERMNHAGNILYHILDRSVDEYMDAISRIEEHVDRMESAVFHNPHIKISRDVFKLKRQIHQLRRVLVEQRTVLHTITHQEYSCIPQESKAYFIDVYDHIMRVTDSLDVFRESISGLLEMQMNMKSDRMNEIMKTLTIISSIFLPLTFIVGIYGMNFRRMPELNWDYGYLLVWGILAAVAIGMWFFYKKKRWL
jgi:magnesium transporter